MNHAVTPRPYKLAWISNNSRPETVSLEWLATSSTSTTGTEGLRCRRLGPRPGPTRDHRINPKGQAIFRDRIAYLGRLQTRPCRSPVQARCDSDEELSGKFVWVYTSGTFSGVPPGTALGQLVVRSSDTRNRVSVNRTSASPPSVRCSLCLIASLAIQS